jgi:hypothetical protein
LHKSNEEEDFIYEGQEGGDLLKFTLFGGRIIGLSKGQSDFLSDINNYDQERETLKENFRELSSGSKYSIPVKNTTRLCSMDSFANSSIECEGEKL